MFLKHFIFMLITALISFSVVAGATDSYSVNAGQTVTIDEFGVCKDVTNSLGLGMMVPTKTANEWHVGGNSFLENLYAGVSVADCPPACSGTLMGGYCWYQGDDGQNCTQICSGKGGVNMTGTTNYAGSGGTLSNCNNLSLAFGNTSGNSPVSNDGYAAACGCTYWEANGFGGSSSPPYNAGLVLHHPNQTTTASCSFSEYSRFCACNN